jgi:hypothetical protein
MAKYNVDHSCGHSVTYQLVGPHKERDRKIAWLEGQDCAECRKIAFNAANAAAATQVSDSELPGLKGSDKQINWARTIRAGKAPSIREIVRKTAEKFRAADNEQNAALAERAGYRILDNAEARYWIDVRTHSPMGLLQDVLHDLNREGAMPTAQADEIADTAVDFEGGAA